MRRGWRQGKHRPRGPDGKFIKKSELEPKTKPESNSKADAKPNQNQNHRIPRLQPNSIRMHYILTTY